MKTYEFTLVFNLPEMSEATADALFSAGCDDCTPWQSNGVAGADFDREAKSLREAITSAIADAQAAGVRVLRIETEEATTVVELNLSLTTGSVTGQTPTS